jgi:hypothetical protein
MGGIDPHPVTPDPDHFPGEPGLPPGIVRRGKPDFRSLLQAAAHGTRIGAVGGYLCTIVQGHIGQKTLVSSHQTAVDQLLFELHQFSIVVQIYSIKLHMVIN